MTAEQALNALAERVASLRAIARRQGQDARNDGDQAAVERRHVEANAYHAVICEIMELRKKL